MLCRLFKSLMIRLGKYLAFWARLSGQFSLVWNILRRPCGTKNHVGLQCWHVYSSLIVPPHEEVFKSKWDGYGWFINLESTLFEDTWRYSMANPSARDQRKDRTNTEEHRRTGIGIYHKCLQGIEAESWCGRCPSTSLNYSQCIPSNHHSYGGLRVDGTIPNVGGPPSTTTCRGSSAIEPLHIYFYMYMLGLSYYL